VHVPFRASADAIVALLGGQVDLLFDGPTTALNNAAAGKRRMRSVANTPAFGPLKGVPTMAEAGVVRLDISGGLQFFGQAGMPREVLARVNAALAAARSAHCLVGRQTTRLARRVRLVPVATRAANFRRPGGHRHSQRVCRGGAFRRSPENSARNSRFT